MKINVHVPFSLPLFRVLQKQNCPVEKEKKPEEDL